MEEIVAGKVGASLLTRIVRSLCSGRCKGRRKKKEKRGGKCWKCCFAGLPDETDASVSEKHLEYKDKSTSYNILCCSTNVRSNEFEFDMELYNRSSRHLNGTPMCKRLASRETTV